MSFRKVIFWLHLIAGVIAGIVIGIMSFTGAALAFEKQIVAWAERDATRIQPLAENVPWLPIEDLLQRVKEEYPEAWPSGLIVDNDPEKAVTVSLGRGGAFYVDPYTGEVREQGAKGWRDFFHVMEDWHRWLAMGSERRDLGKAVTGVCNTAFLVLAVTGLVIWWPKKWTWRALKPSIWFQKGVRGKARDWNWHNAIGFWSAPVLIVLTLTGMVISYRWAGNLVYTLTGNEPPASRGPGGFASAGVEVPEHPEGRKKLRLDTLLAVAQREMPDWEQISLRLGERPQRGGPPGGPQRETPQAEGGRPERNGGESRRERGDREEVRPVVFTVKEAGRWPLFSSVQLTLDPFTGKTLNVERFKDNNSGRQARSWMRFLHTGEALGIPGQFVAGAASFGGVVLMWTGFALAWRRFLAWRRKR